MLGHSRLVRKHNTTSQDGAEEYEKLTAEVVGLSWNWSNALASSETVASAAYVDSGVTRTNTALAANVTSDDVTGLGETKITVTLSTGRKLEKTFRFIEPGGRRGDDYGN